MIWLYYCSKPLLVDCFMSFLSAIYNCSHCFTHCRCRLWMWNGNKPCEYWLLGMDNGVNYHVFFIACSRLLFLNLFSRSVCCDVRCREALRDGKSWLRFCSYRNWYSCNKTAMHVDQWTLNTDDVQWLDRSLPLCLYSDHSNSTLCFRSR